MSERYYNDFTKFVNEKFGDITAPDGQNDFETMVNAKEAMSGTPEVEYHNDMEKMANLPEDG